MTAEARGRARCFNYRYLSRTLSAISRPSIRGVIAVPKNDRTVSQRDDGQWANKKDGASRATSLHNTQKQAADAARDALKRTGGGELKIKGEDNRIRAKDTIPPAVDPRRTKG